MLLGVLLLAVLEATVAAQRPHILMIVADDLGWNDVPWHGSNQIEAPTLARLAADGVLTPCEFLVYSDYYFMEPSMGTHVLGPRRPMHVLGPRR